MQSVLVMRAIIVGALLVCVMAPTRATVMSTNDGETLVHYGFKTDNGHTRTEDIKYNQTQTKQDHSDGDNISKNTSDDKNSTATGKKRKGEEEIKQVEYQGGYSFISADGYEYSVLYKANKNGFHPYVTAKKIKTD